MKRLTDTSIEDVRNNLDAFDITDWEEEIYNKLAEYENFMEENGFESLEDIKQLIKNMEYYEGRYKWQCKNSRINYEEFLNLQQENEQLKQQLSEKDKLLETAIVPKFKVGECYFMIYRYSVNENWKIFKCIIRAYKSTNDILVIICDREKPEQLISWVDNLIFSTEQEAEEALKKLNKE